MPVICLVCRYFHASRTRGRKKVDIASNNSMASIIKKYVIYEGQKEKVV